jgi:hypothetical protein
LPSKIIISSSEEDFQKLKKAFINEPNRGMYHTGSLMNSTIVDADTLTKQDRQKMTRAAKKNVTAVNVSMAPPIFYHPLFETTNMMLPRDRRERNEWCRQYYRTEPVIATAIDMHTEFPISDFNIMCSDEGIKKLFDYMLFDKLNIYEILLNIGLEYWKIGDVFPYGQLNEEEGVWERFVCYDPDFINIIASPLAGESIIELIPDAEIKAIVTGGAAGEYRDLYKQLPPEIVTQVKQGKNIRLDNRFVSHIAHKAAPYEMWGTPAMMRCFKTLIYKDKLRAAQQAIADRHITPLRVAKIGAAGEPYPTQADIDDFRETLIAIDGDPSSFLVYHYGLQFEYVGSSGHILPLNTEFDFIQKELMNGLGINEAMLNGEGPTYANAEVGFNTLAKRYMSYRLRLENWIRYKVLKPISKIQGFYTSNNGEIESKYMTEKQRKISAARNDMSLIVPEIKWQQEDLSSDQNIMNIIQALRDKGLVSAKTMLPMVGLNPDIELKNLKEEEGTAFDVHYDPTAPIVKKEESKQVLKDEELIPIDTRNTIPQEV